MGVVFDQCVVAAEEDVLHVVPLAEVEPVGGDSGVTGRGGAVAVVSVGGEEACLAVADEVKGRPGLSIRLEEIDACLCEFDIVGGVVEGGVEHDVDLFGVGGGDEALEGGHGGGPVLGEGVRTVVVDGHEFVDFKEVFHRVGAAGIVSGGAAFDAVGVDGLEPEPVHAEVLEVVEIPAVVVIVGSALGVVQVFEGGSLGKGVAAGFDVEDVDLVHADVAGVSRGDDDSVVAQAVVDPLVRV